MSARRLVKLSPTNELLIDGANIARIRPLVDGVLDNALAMKRISGATEGSASGFELSLLVTLSAAIGVLLTAIDDIVEDAANDDNEEGEE